MTELFEDIPHIGILQTIYFKNWYSLTRRLKLVILYSIFYGSIEGNTIFF